MPIANEEQYARAQSLMNDPELPSGHREKLAASIQRYERVAHPERSAERQGGMFREGLPDTFRAGPSEAKPHELVSTIEQAEGSEIPGARGEETPEEAAERLEKESLRQRQQSSLASASKDPEIFRLPEYTAYDKPGGPSFGDSIPALIGGNVQHYEEPTVEQFRAEMGPALQAQGKNVADLTELSDEYKRYADLKWAQVYDKARAAGQPVVRLDYIDRDDWQEQFGYGAHKAFDQVYSAAAGVANGIAPGSTDAINAIGGRALGDSTAVTQGRLAEQRNPIANIGGAIAGIANPMSLGSRVTGGVSKAVGGAAPGLARGTAASALGGGVGAATEGFVGDVVSRAVDAAEGRGVSVLGFDDLRTAGKRAALGGAAGAGGELVGRGLNKFREAVRGGRRGPALAAAEDAGVETDVLRGVRFPKEIQENVDEARRTTTHELDVATERARGPIAEAGHRLNVETRDRIRAETEDAYRQLKGQTVSARPVAERLQSILEQRSSGDTGTELPFVETDRFKKQISRLWTTEVVPQSRAGELAQREGGIVLSQEQAAERGLDVSGAMERARRVLPERRMGPDGSPLPQEPVAILLRPTKLSAEELDEVTDAIDEAAGLVKSRSGRSDEGYRELSRAIREARDQFKLGDTPGGYSELKSKHSQELTGTEQTLGHAGFQSPKETRPFEEMSAGEQTAISSNIREFRGGAGRGDKDRALLRLAEQAGPEAVADLKRVAGTRFGRQLREGSLDIGLGGSGRPMLRGLTDFSTLRADAAARVLASVPESVRGLLRSMRTGESRRFLDLGQAVGAAPGGFGAQALGLRGGQIGSRAGAEDQELTQEDLANLGRLLRTLSATEVPQEATP